MRAGLFRTVLAMSSNGASPVSTEIGPPWRVRRTSTSFTRARNGFAGFAIGGAAAFGFALVPQLFATGERYFHFHFAVLEIDSRRYQGEPTLLGLADQFADFFPVHEQLASAERGMIEDVSVFVGADV